VLPLPNCSLYAWKRTSASHRGSPHGLPPQRRLPSMPAPQPMPACRLQACKLQTHSAAVGLHAAEWAGMHDRAVAAVAAAAGTPVEASVALAHRRVIAPVGTPAPDDFPGLYSATLSATMLPRKPFHGTVPGVRSSEVRRPEGATARRCVQGTRCWSTRSGAARRRSWRWACRADACCA
jgi:hypothetical protein